MQPFGQGLVISQALYTQKAKEGPSILVSHKLGLIKNVGQKNICRLWSYPMQPQEDFPQTGTIGLADGFGGYIMIKIPLCQSLDGPALVFHKTCWPHQVFQDFAIQLYNTFKIIGCCFPNQLRSPGRVCLRRILNQHCFNHDLFLAVSRPPIGWSHMGQHFLIEFV